MQFATPERLFWLWILIPIALLMLLALRHRERLMAKFLDRSLWADVASGYDPAFWPRRFLIILGVIFFSLLAIARPQWGFEWQEVKRQGVDVLIALDTSKSMLTQDIKPSRLERSKLAIKDFVRRLKGDRVGLIAFAGDALLLCPLTLDENGFLMSLEEAAVDSVPRGGTNLGRAVEVAINAYKLTPSEHKAIIIVTDGENVEGDPLAAARKAKDNGVKIHTIGVGTAQGELIKITNDRGQPEFLKDNEGHYVKSRLNESTLQQMALTTGGVYIKAGGADFGLDVLYDRELAKLKKWEMQDKKEKKFEERFQIPLAGALVLLVWETVFRSRRRKIINGK